MTRRPPLLLSLVLERRAAAPPFVPRALSAEEHGRLAAMSVRGKWDADAEERAATPAVLRDLAVRAARAFKRSRGKPPVQVERVYGDARKSNG